MRNLCKILGLVALVAAIGFSMAACDDGSGGPGGGGGGGGFTITGIPSKYNGKYVAAAVDGDVDVVGFQTYNAGNPTLSRIQNGTVSIPMWIAGYGGFNKYTGNDTFDIGVTITNAEKLHDTNSTNLIARVDFMSVKFSNGNATRSWSDVDKFY